MTRTAAASSHLPGGGRRSAEGVPGKRTLTDALPAGAAPQQAQQAEENGGALDNGALDPAATQVHQYAEGTDLTRYNDCGPAVVLMAIRSMGAEDELRAHLVETLGRSAEEIGLADELTFIREHSGALVRDAQGAALDPTLTVNQVREALIATLLAIGISASRAELTAHLQLATEELGWMSPDSNAQDGHHRAEAFIEEHTGNGEAVIVLGQPVETGEGQTDWGWGGNQDKRTRAGAGGAPQSIAPPTGNGGHYVYVWRNTLGYVVMDPSWSSPRFRQTLAGILEFIGARGPGTTINVMAVPFGDLATLLPGAVGAEAEAPRL